MTSVKTNIKSSDKDVNTTDKNMQSKKVKITKEKTPIKESKAVELDESEKKTHSKKVKMESVHKKIIKDEVHDIVEGSEDKTLQAKKVKIDSKHKKIIKDVLEISDSDINLSDKITSDLKFQTQFANVNDTLKKFKEYYNVLYSEVKKLETSYNYDLKKIKKFKQKRTGNYQPTGFTKPQPIPQKLAKFIDVQLGTELTGPQITQKVWQQLKLKNLVYEKDKRIFRTNKDISELFGVPETVNNSTDHKDVENGFNFCNLQKYIAYALKH